MPKFVYQEYEITVKQLKISNNIYFPNTLMYVMICDIEIDFGCYSDGPFKSLFSMS